MKIYFEMLIRSILISILVVVLILSIIIKNNVVNNIKYKSIIKLDKKNKKEYVTNYRLTNPIVKNHPKEKSFKIIIPKIDDILNQEDNVLLSIHDINMNDIKKIDEVFSEKSQDNQNELVESNEIIYNNN